MIVKERTAIAARSGEYSKRHIHPRHRLHPSGAPDAARLPCLNAASNLDIFIVRLPRACTYGPLDLGRRLAAGLDEPQDKGTRKAIEHDVPGEHVIGVCTVREQPLDDIRPPLSNGGVERTEPPRMGWWVDERSAIHQELDDRERSRAARIR